MIMALNALLVNHLGMKKDSTISFRAVKSYEDLTRILAKKERRPEGAIARAIYERGIAALARDHQLFEPDPPDIDGLIEKFGKASGDGGKKERRPA